MAVDFEKHEGKVVEAITFEVTHDVTVELIGALLEASFSDCFWADRIAVPKSGTIFVDGTVQSYLETGLYKSEWLALGGVLTYHVEGEKKGLARDAFVDAIRDYCMKTNQTPSELLDTHDAGDADAIVQMALFGEAVYG